MCAPNAQYLTGQYQTCGRLVGLVIYGDGCCLSLYQIMVKAANPIKAPKVKKHKRIHKNAAGGSKDAEIHNRDRLAMYQVSLLPVCRPVKIFREKR